MTPFFRLRYSSAEKEGKSAVLDYWQLEVLLLVLFCIRKNSLVSNFYAGRAGCLSGTRRTCQNPPLGFPSRSALPLVWLRQYSLRASLPGFHPYGNPLKPLSQARCTSAGSLQNSPDSRAPCTVQKSCHTTSRYPNTCTDNP